jgi:hypothetical protein
MIEYTTPASERTSLSVGSLVHPRFAGRLSSSPSLVSFLDLYSWAGEALERFAGFETGCVKRCCRSRGASLASTRERERERDTEREKGWGGEGKEGVKHRGAIWINCGDEQMVQSEVFGRG